MKTTKPVRTHEYLQQCYERRRDRILNNCLYKGRERFTYTDGCRIIKEAAGVTRTVMDRMEREGYLERSEERKHGNQKIIIFRRKDKSPLQYAWVKPWAHSLNYSPQWR